MILLTGMKSLKNPSTLAASRTRRGLRSKNHASQKTKRNTMSSPDSDKNDNNIKNNELLYEEEYRPPFLPVLALAFPILPLFWEYHVAISKTELSFGYTYSIVTKTAPRTEVIEAEPFEIKPLRQWGGWGIRLRLGHYQTGYIAQGGPGVKVTLKDEKGNLSVYVFSCKEPEFVCDILNN